MDHRNQSHGEDGARGWHREGRTDSPTRVMRSCGHTASSWRSSCTVRAVSWSQLDRSDSGMNSDLCGPQSGSLAAVVWPAATEGFEVGAGQSVSLP